MGDIYFVSMFHVAVLVVLPKYDRLFTKLGNY